MRNARVQARAFFLQESEAAEIASARDEAVDGAAAQLIADAGCAGSIEAGEAGAVDGTPGRFACDGCSGCAPDNIQGALADSGDLTLGVRGVRIGANLDGSGAGWR